MPDPYYASRYTWNNDRTLVWKEIVRYLAPFIPAAGTVLDVGAGYCDFINNVAASERIALDISPDSKQYAAPGVRTLTGALPKELSDQSVDVVFASNLFEHLDDSELARLMEEIKRILRPGGRLILMQPNYRLSYKNYFDDPTHKKVFSDVSLKAFLVSHGFDVVLEKPRFLPFSLKSRPGIIPLFPWIVRLYLNLPWKPFAGQMLFVVRKK